MANLTREDAHEFLTRGAAGRREDRGPRYPLAEANAALADLREGRLQGAAVLIGDLPGRKAQ